MLTDPHFLAVRVHPRRHTTSPATLTALEVRFRVASCCGPGATPAGPSLWALSQSSTPIPRLPFSPRVCFPRRRSGDPTKSVPGSNKQQKLWTLIGSPVGRSGGERNLLAQNRLPRYLRRSTASHLFTMRQNATKRNTEIFKFQKFCRSAGRWLAWARRPPAGGWGPASRRAGAGDPHPRGRIPPV